MKKKYLIVILCFMPFILYYGFFKIQEYDAKMEAQCPGWYDKREHFPKQYKAILVKKNVRNGEGMVKPNSMSIDLNNQGETLHVSVYRHISLNTLFDKRFWDYIEEGDSIIKPANSYRVKVVKSNKDFRFFDVDCEAHKESLKK